MARIITAVALSGGMPVSSNSMRYRDRDAGCERVKRFEMAAIIRATGEAFLGTTVGCARCHDHKFDPVLRDDYYGLYATFAGVYHGDRVIGAPTSPQPVAWRTVGGRTGGSSICTSTLIIRRNIWPGRFGSWTALGSAWR